MLASASHFHRNFSVSTSQYSTEPDWPALWFISIPRILSHIFGRFSRIFASFSWVCLNIWYPQIPELKALFSHHFMALKWGSSMIFSTISTILLVIYSTAWYHTPLYYYTPNLSKSHLIPMLRLTHSQSVKRFHGGNPHSTSRLNSQEMVGLKFVIPFDAPLVKSHDILWNPGSGPAPCPEKGTPKELFAGARAVPVALGLTPKLQALRAQSDGETKASAMVIPVVVTIWLIGDYYITTWY